MPVSKTVNEGSNPSTPVPKARSFKAPGFFISSQTLLTHNTKSPQPLKSIKQDKRATESLKQCTKLLKSTDQSKRATKPPKQCMKSPNKAPTKANEPQSCQSSASSHQKAPIKKDTNKANEQTSHKAPQSKLPSPKVKHRASQTQPRSQNSHCSRPEERE